MKKILITVLNILIASQVYSSSMLYHINFASPDQLIDQVVIEGDAPDHISEVAWGSPTVVSSSGSLTEQPLLFDLGSSSPYDQVRLIIPEYDEPALNIDFDFGSTDFIGSVATFTVFLDTPTVRNIHFNNDGSIHMRAFDGVTGYVVSPPNVFTDNFAYHASIRIDEQLNTWAVYIDGTLIGSESFYADVRISIIRMSYGVDISAPLDSSTMAIDNISIIAVPEFSSTTLALSLIVLISTRFRKKKPNQAEKLTL